MSDAATTPPPPQGFVRLPKLGPGGFGILCGPLWVRTDGKMLIMGFRVEDKHCNAAGICHGGMMAMFCDTCLAVAAQYQARLGTAFLSTISLSLDYLAPTPNGAWVEGRVEIAKTTRSMVFANALVTADGEPVTTARGIFKIPPPAADPARETSGRLRTTLGT